MARSPAETAAAPTSRPHPLRNRILSAVVLGPLALALVWWADRGSPGYVVFHVWIALAAGWMGHEWVRLTAPAKSVGIAGFLLVAAAAASVAATAVGVAVWESGLALAAAGALIYGLARGGGVEAPGWLATGAVTIGVPCAAFVWLRERPAEGGPLVFWLLAVVWATDVSAYAVGRAVGGPRLAPRVSPNKTWAGLAGGVAAAALTGGLAGSVMGGSGPVLALVAGGLAVVAQAGDLGESLVKRRFGAKDAGALIPGHGGLLDRVDGLLTTTPVVALAVWLKGGSVLAWT